MKKPKPPSIVTVLVLTLITVIMWVTFDVYRAFNTPAVPSVPLEVSNPITPTLDQPSIDQLESRTFLDDSQIPDNVINSSVSPALVFSPTTGVEATASGTTKQSPQNASSSGTPL